MAENVEMDQKVYDELIAQGKSERIARAKAKAAAVRAKKEAAGEKLGPRDPAEQAEKAAATAGGGGGGAQAGGGGVATEQRTGGGFWGMSPEERQKRVAAALAARGNGGGNGGATQTPTRYAGQEHTHRLLAMVPPSGIQQIRGKQEDKVYTWPHLLLAEFIALLALMAFITLFSSFAPAPLRELANPNITPNPSKAPWYFLGLQELLRYFHPMIAGVTIPGIVGLLGLMAMPYIDKNPSVQPENRKTSYMVMTFFLVGSAVLTMAGSFFRGPGFNWTWPWVDGIWFTL
jgi:menaquinol-cytochrome c reductase cytochrome b/c subunit